MIIRTSRAEEASFLLEQYQLVENECNPYVLNRVDLKLALEDKSAVVQYVIRYRDYDSQPFSGSLLQGKTQRGKKFIQIGCKRFVGVNRTRLIRWAKGAKGNR